MSSKAFTRAIVDWRPRASGATFAGLAVPPQLVDYGLDSEGRHSDGAPVAITDFPASGLLARRMIQAPTRQTALPSTDSSATLSWRTITPRTRATTGIRNVVAEARVAPSLPAATAMTTWATPVPRAPSARREAAGPGIHRAAKRSGNPNGAVNTSATIWARQMTGKAPLRSCSGLAILSANPYETIAARISPTPATLLCPSPIDGRAVTTVPIIPD